MKTARQTSIRDDYKQQTRARILDSAIDLIESGGELPLTVASVASRAGVTDRTVYRHFDTRDELLRSAWRRIQERVAQQGFPRTAQEAITSPRALFPRFDGAKGLVCASLHSADGRELRMSSNAERQEATLAAVRDAFPDVGEEQARRRAAIVQLISSAYAWDVMRRYWDFNGEEAGRAASEALAVLLDNDLSQREMKDHGR